MKPELLAPAGDFAALKAAVGNGADAVYLGAGMFNARRKASNFDPQQLAEAIEYAHLRSVKVYLALNTLIADDEGDQALELAAQAYSDGIDAVILQDIGLASVLHQMLPDLPLHASTQMTIHDLAGLRAAARLGIKRVILPRELSLAEIAVLTAYAESMGMATEVFVHGALCVSFSGQCLLSSMSGGRSGNRGECAQPCRLPWQLSGQKGAQFPYLSPKDQALIEHLPALTQAGVASLKIEGRMRSSGYVGQVVSVYRATLDRSENSPDQTNTDLRRLKLAFNRGGSFTDRYLTGSRKPDFLSGIHTGSHGVLLGTIVKLEPRHGVLSLMTAPEWPAGIVPVRGDVLSIRRDGSSQETASAPIGTISSQGRQLQIKGFHPDVLANLQEGDPVYVMNDHLAEQSVLKADLRRTRLDLSISQGQSGEIMLKASVADGQGSQAGLTACVSKQSEAVQPLTAERVEQQLRKTGGTPFQADQISVDGSICLTVAELNDLRRQLLDLIGDQLVRHFQRQLPLGFTASWSDAIAHLPTNDSKAETQKQAKVTVYYARIPDSISEIACGADLYYLPLFELTPQNAPVIRQIIRDQEPQSQVMVWVPAAGSGRSAILIDELLQLYPGWGFDGICAGHPGLDLLAESETRLVVDQGANIFNQASLKYYRDLGVSAACLSAELDNSRLLVICQAAAAAGIMIELPIFGRYRLMTSEFCPIGQNLPGCHKCHEQPNSWRLTDRKGQSFPLLPQPRVCTTEIYGHDLLSAAWDLALLAESGADLAGIRARLTFVFEKHDERVRLTTMCRKMMSGATPADRQLLADEFQEASRRSADRQNSSLSHGHYRQGV